MLYEIFLDCGANYMNVLMHATHMETLELATSWLFSYIYGSVSVRYLHVDLRAAIDISPSSAILDPLRHSTSFRTKLKGLLACSGVPETGSQRTPKRQHKSAFPLCPGAPRRARPLPAWAFASVADTDSDSQMPSAPFWTKGKPLE